MLQLAGSDSAVDQPSYRTPIFLVTATARTYSGATGHPSLNVLLTIVNGDRGPVMQFSSTSSYASSKPDGAAILPTPDEALIDAIVDGDKNALRELYGRHRETLTRFLTRLTKKPTLAEEITNEVFLVVWQRAHEFQGRSRVSTWLMGIARHKAISAFRRQHEVQLDDGFALTIADPSDNAAAKMD